jgi:mRNA interferase MazF
MPYTPQRGDVVWLEFDPQTGHEQKGTRPALVISPRAYNAKVGLAIFCPITNEVKGYPFEVPIPPGCAVTGVVLSDQIKSLDWRARSAVFKCTLPRDTIEEVIARIAPLIF